MQAKIKSRKYWTLGNEIIYDMRASAFPTVTVSFSPMDIYLVNFHFVSISRTWFSLTNVMFTSNSDFEICFNMLSIIWVPSPHLTRCLFACTYVCVFFFFFLHMLDFSSCTKNGFFIVGFYDLETVCIYLFHCLLALQVWLLGWLFLYIFMHWLVVDGLTHLYLKPGMYWWRQNWLLWWLSWWQIVKLKALNVFVCILLYLSS